MKLPRYDELPRGPRGIPSARGLFGDDDSLGLMGLQTPESVRRAAALIERGAVFPLDAAADAIDPPMFGRSATKRTPIVDLGGIGVDDRLDECFPQGSSHWDALGHIAFEENAFYNGATLDDVVGGRRNTIDHWARMGIVGRAVVLDLDDFLGRAGDGFDPASSRAISAAELDACRDACNATFEEGDIVLLHTGFMRWYAEQPRDVREQLADERQLAAIGLAHEEETVRYLWDNRVRGVASDCPSLEVWPPDWSPEAWPFGFLHQMLLGQLGMAIGELWWLADLADDCRVHGRYEVFLSSAPMNLRGAIGSPPHALAIK